MKHTKTNFLFFAFSGLIIVFGLTLKRVPSKIDVKYIQLDSISQLIEIEDTLVVPIVYDKILIDTLAGVRVRKKQFINQLLPAILISKYELFNEKQHVESLLGKKRTKHQDKYIKSLLKKYRAKSIEELPVRLITHPTSLVLAQAIVESGWGTSRFASEGNNLFGVWSSKNDPNVIKSKFDREDKKIFVKKYDNIAQSIRHYFLTIGRHRAYRKFRKKRADEVALSELIDQLNSYSERGEEYTELLKNIVRWNKLKQYDLYQIHPDYIRYKYELDFSGIFTYVTSGGLQKVDNPVSDK